MTTEQPSRSGARLPDEDVPCAPPGRGSARPDGPAREGGRGPRRARRLLALDSALVSFVAYTAVFAALSFRWLLAADRGIPAGYLGNAADERLVVWVLAWIAHAVADPSVAVLDANINHPAPAQLTGTEHFATFQVLFAPLYALTDNALLAANLTLFLTYPLAALVMQRLLIALGCGASVASVVGLVFAVGPFRVPANLHLLQYTNLFLPLVALALTRLRQEPTALRAALLAVSLIAAALSSYYVALLTGVLALVWGLFELLDRPGERLRFVVLAGGAGAVAATLVVLVSLPWLSRPEVANEPPFTIARAAAREFNLRLFFVHAVESGGTIALVLGGIGVVGLLFRDRVARLCAKRGLLITLLAQFTGMGAVLTIGGTKWLTPFALIEASPARFFRYPFRFAVLAGFGTAVLAAAALQAVSLTLGRHVARAAVVGIAIAVVVTQATRIPGKRTDEFVGHAEPAYEMVARITRARGPGPLLELPIVPPIADKKVLGTEVVSMLGSTRHWLPLVAGFTGYQPPHRSFVMRAIDELPSRRALQRLIDMTHVRWILLQPPDRWPQSRIAQRDKLLRSPLLRQIAAKGGWVLLRVKPSTRDLGWYEAIAAGPHPERTILGTSLAPIPEKDAAAVVHARARSPIEAGKLTLVRFWVRNVGAATWPMSAMTEEDECARCVRVVAAWRPVGRAAGKPVKRQYAPLPIDMLPGEELTFARWLEAPDDPGTYRLQVRVEQTEGAQFSGRGNVDADVRVKVVPAQDGPVKEPADKAA